MAHKSQVLIASYAKDFEWLIHCLGSLKRFASGFLPPRICVDSVDEIGARKIVAQAFPEAEVVVMNGRPGQGGIRAQVAMMMADILCPNANFVFLTGSDTIVIDTFSPDPYFASDGRPAMLFTEYSAMIGSHSNALPWRKGVTRVLGWEPHAEFMRRLPLVYPRGLFAPFRNYVAELHHQKFEDFVYQSDVKHRDTSESNCLGAYAWRFHPEMFCWVDTEKAGTERGNVKGWPSNLVQFWSHGGLDRITEANFTYGDGKCSRGRTPRSIINEILYNLI